MSHRRRRGPDLRLVLAFVTVFCAVAAVTLACVLLAYDRPVLP